MTLKSSFTMMIIQCLVCPYLLSSLWFLLHAVVEAAPAPGRAPRRPPPQALPITAPKGHPHRPEGQGEGLGPHEGVRGHDPPEVHGPRDGRRVVPDAPAGVL